MLCGFMHSLLPIRSRLFKMPNVELEMENLSQFLMTSVTAQIRQKQNFFPCL